MRIHRIAAILASFFITTAWAAVPEIPVEDFAKFSEFTEVRISPGGNYLAVAAPAEEQTGIAILDISEYPQMKMLGGFKFSPFEHVSRIFWANDTRVMFTTARQEGTLNQPRDTGRLYAMDADGSNRRLLHGTADGDMVGRGSILLSLLRDDPQHILLATYAHDRQRPFVEKINVNSGRTDIVATSPLENGSIHVDRNDVARFAVSVNEDLSRRIAYRESAEADWQERQVEWEEDFSVVGFTADNQRVLITTNTADAMGLYAMDPVTLEREPLMTNTTVDIDSLIRSIDDRDIVGAVFVDGLPENRFLDEEERTAKLYRLLEKAFPGTRINVTSATRDGRTAVIEVENDRLPGDYFLFDTEDMKADFLVSSRPWLDPAALSPMKPISFKARDGKTLHGYLTLPRDREAKDLPLVTVVHGGPHGPRDDWNFDYEAQLLANRGYAVLQVNYRGSGGYGKDFEQAGYRHWGDLIQDDIMDGVQWVVGQGIADEERLCVYGGSFGGYSALQQIVRYPDTYACSFAFVGIYDMQLMFEEGDIPSTERGQSFLRLVLGTDEDQLREFSPVHHVEKINTPLYVAHGEEDIRAHVEHYHVLIEALEEAGIPHEQMLVENEGHGFYKMENRIMYYEALLDFLDEHIGE